jgi:hypothetical protein
MSILGRLVGTAQSLQATHTGCTISAMCLVYDRIRDKHLRMNRSRTRDCILELGVDYATSVNSLRDECKWSLCSHLFVGCMHTYSGIDFFMLKEWDVFRKNAHL